MFSYILNKNFSWGPCGADWGHDPLALPYNFPWLGEIAPIGDRRPWTVVAS